MTVHDIYSKTIAHYLAPISQYLADTRVTEIMVNRGDEIYIERDGQLHKTDAAFDDEQAYQAAVNNILQFTGRTLSDDQPLIDSRLPDGSRVHVAKQPCSRLGMTMTIRKFSKQMLDVDWLIELGTLTPQACQYLKVAVQAERNILVAGGTSSGKTSLLNALSNFIPDRQRIVAIEDSAELDLQQEHVISLEARLPDRYGHGAVSIRDLFRSSLRLRPDRIIIGEVRGGEALEMIQAMTSGHGGSMGTLHANNPADALNRLETMAMMSQVELPLHALRAQISSAIDVVVQMSRHIGGRRMVTQITEVDAMADPNHYELRDLFTMSPSGDPNDPKQVQLAWTGMRSTLAGRLRPQEQQLVTDQIESLFEVDTTAMADNNKVE